MRSVVALVGFMAAGKTAVGHSLAGRLELPFVDLDRKIGHESQETVVEIIRSRGEDAFRLLERKALEETLREGNCVLATGGGVVLDATNRRRLRESARVVWLDLRLEEIVARLSRAERQERPLAEGLTVRELMKLFEQRRQSYAACAHLRVEAGGRTPQRLSGVIASLLEKMELPPPVEER